MRTTLPFRRTVLDGPAQTVAPVMSLVRRMISRRQGAPAWAGILTVLEQMLMQHLVQQGVVVGDEKAAAGWQVECDGASSSVVFWAVRALSNAFTERQRRDDERDGLQRAVEVGRIELGPGVGDFAPSIPHASAAW